MKYNSLSILFFCCVSFCCFSQKEYPKNKFSPPLDIPIILSGTFGELRNNHFHSGIDIKTQEKEGIKVLAAANGYVSRLKISQYGYGKAIYITHPNGYTTVYAHLKKYAPKIEQYVKKNQYKKKRYAIGNIFLSKDKFPVKKGELIAYTGDTGSSGGPHLHYEFRNTETEKIINPLHFGISPKDTKHPTFQSLIAYPLDVNSRINLQKNKINIPIKKAKNGIYIADKISASGTIGFGVTVFDRLNEASNKNGIYSLEMLVNGKSIYHHNVDTFSFSESKYINLLIDYEYYKTYKKRVQKTHKVASNKLSIYKNLINDGKLIIKEGLNYTIKIIAKDFKGNTSTIKIPIIGRKSNAIFSEKKETTAYKVIAKNFNKFKKNEITIAFPKHTFYKDVYLDFKVEDGIAKIHNPTIPLNKKFTLTFDVSKYSKSEKQQLYIANIEYTKFPRYQYTRKKDTIFYTTTKILGNYTLLLDKQKPKIKLLSFRNNQWISNHPFIKVKINDIGAGIKSYYATIDGNWILMEYNHKKGILTYDFNDKKLKGSKHLFKIVVSDNVKNTSTLSATFYRKQSN